MRLISRLAQRRHAATRPLMVAPIQALMQAVPSKDQLQHLIRTLKPGQELEPEKLIVWLARARLQPARPGRSPRRFRRPRRDHRRLPPRRFRGSDGETAESRSASPSASISSATRSNRSKPSASTRSAPASALDGVRIIDLKGHRRSRPIDAPLQLPAEGDGRHPLGAARDRRAGQELPRSPAGGEGRLSARRDAEEHRAVHAAGAEPVRPGHRHDAELRRRAAGAAGEAAGAVAAKVRDRGEEGDRGAGGVLERRTTSRSSARTRGAEPVRGAARAGVPGACEEASTLATGYLHRGFV